MFSKPRFKTWKLFLLTALSVVCVYLAIQTLSGELYWERDCWDYYNKGYNVTYYDCVRDVATKPKSVTPSYDVTPVARQGFNPPWSCEGCFRWTYQVVRQSGDICKLHSPNQTIDLIFLIPSAHDQFHRRQAVRQTWASLSRNNTSNFRHVFFFGVTDNATRMRQVEEEARHFRDMVTFNFEDTYRNLTVKTLMLMTWFTEECSHARFFLKVDDDMWLNVGMLMTHLNAAEDQMHTATAGYCNMDSNVIRNTHLKWGASRKEYPADKYPQYCSGTAYAGTLNVAKNVAQVSHDIPFFFLEDVFVGLCLQRLNFTVVKLSGFSMGHPPWVKKDPCVVWKPHVVTLHQVSAQDLLKYWNQDCQQLKKGWFPIVL